MDSKATRKEKATSINTQKRAFNASDFSVCLMVFNNQHQLQLAPNFL